MSEDAKPILVAHPSPEFRGRLRQALLTAGFSVVQATDANKLYETVETQGGRLDLALVHLPLPGLPGAEVLATIRDLARKQKIPVLVLGLYRRPERLKQAVARQGLEVLDQEPTVEAILEQVHSILIPPPPPPDPEIARKRAPRAVVWLPAVAVSDDDIHEGTVLNLSESGLFFQTDPAPPKGTTAEISFSLPGIAEIRAPAEVIWVRAAAGARPPGVGMHFGAMEAESRDALSQFMTALLDVDQDVEQHQK